MTLQFGHGMDGLEEQFEKALRERAKDFQFFNYIEIGIAQCETFAAVVQILEDTNAVWTATGIDPDPDCWVAFEKRCSLRLYPHDVTLIPLTRLEAFQHWHRTIHLALIDGCHSRRCAMLDFQSVEIYSVPGTLVLFHDFGEAHVGIGLQPHCNEMMDVRGAVKELGLFDDSRPGWKRLPDWMGHVTPAGTDMGVFERM